MAALSDVVTSPRHHRWVEVGARRLARLWLSAFVARLAQTTVSAIGGLRLVAWIGRAVLGGSSVGTRMQEERVRDSTFRHAFVPPIHRTSLAPMRSRTASETATSELTVSGPAAMRAIAARLEGHQRTRAPTAQVRSRKVMAFNQVVPVNAPINPISDMRRIKVQYRTGYTSSSSI